ncbi:hypothetical protein DBR42_20245, partial [Pelomonas sp. HMWF004]
LKRNGHRFAGRSQAIRNHCRLAAVEVTDSGNKFVLGTTFLRGVMVTTIGALVIPGTLLAVFLIFARSHVS